MVVPASPYHDCPPRLARALTVGASAGRQQVEAALTAGGLAPVVNGWTPTFHMFDYNLDRLGPGTIDDLAWKMKDRSASYLARAPAARGGCRHQQLAGRLVFRQCGQTRRTRRRVVA